MTKSFKALIDQHRESWRPAPTPEQRAAAAAAATADPKKKKVLPPPTPAISKYPAFVTWLYFVLHHRHLLFSAAGPVPFDLLLSMDPALQMIDECQR